MAYFGRLLPDRTIDFDPTALALAPIPVTVISTAVASGPRQLYASGVGAAGALTSGVLDFGGLTMLGAIGRNRNGAGIRSLFIDVYDDAGVNILWSTQNLGNANVAGTVAIMMNVVAAPVAGVAADADGGTATFTSVNMPIVRRLAVRFPTNGAGNLGSLTVWGA